ncbi:hypothetical protein [Pseudoalteromonas luteoviolacea]|uniref:hypothetical protein n=1 Tax=Pseudoalteromonas luteoviolacea TaxID=43657 RepID=UPI001B382E4E|nr:hypothetical protein [Pseudoalteromonas luteoviolacea]MBQ4839788.1 hypothetical protein [Pseudoalteromonas luteoviolacea]
MYTLTKRVVLNIFRLIPSVSIWGMLTLLLHTAVIVIAATYGLIVSGSLPLEILVSRGNYG